MYPYRGNPNERFFFFGAPLLGGFVGGLLGGGLAGAVSRPRPYYPYPPPYYYGGPAYQQPYQQPYPYPYPYR